jgi:hypothetical protein
MSKVINPKLSIMYETTPTIYFKLATLLVEQIGMRHFFSGAVVCHDGDIECRLICTVVVSRDRHNPRCITSIAPVWWEMRTTSGEEELCNDFSFSEMLQCLE